MKVDGKPIIDFAEKCIKANTPKTMVELAGQFNVHTETIRKILKKSGLYVQFKSIRPPVKEQIKVDRTAIDKKLAKKRYNEALIRIQELEDELEIIKHIDGLDSLITPAQFEIEERKGSKEATAIALLSDWHIDEKVHSDSIGGVNQFDIKIAKQRANILFTNTLKLLNMCRKESKINTLVIGALGDFITSWIHQDLIEDSVMTPPEALIILFDLLVGGIDFLLENAELEKLIFVGVCGNHTRITQKIPIKKTAAKNYEWLIYRFLHKWYLIRPGKPGTRLGFKLPDGYFNRLTVYNKVIRFHHGDGIRYHGGVGGIHIPLRKAIAQWNKAQHADLDVLGHWHTREASKDYVINGSLIGYNEYAERIKADYERPQQAFFILHPKFGKTAEFPIILE